MPRLPTRLFDLVRRVARRFADDRGMRTAGSLTFTTLLALVPIITVALALMSALPMFRGLAGTIQAFVFDNLMPDSVDVVEGYAKAFVDNAGQLTAVGIVLLVVTAIMLLLTIDAAFNDIWRVRYRRPMVRRLLIYAALITLGPLLVGASLTLSSWLLSASAGWTADIPYASVSLIKLSAMALTCAALALLYYAMPNRPVRATDALMGGLFAAVAFEFTKHGFGFYVTQVPTYTLVYGAFAAVPMFLLWLFVSWVVVLAGAVTVATLPEWREQSVQGRLAPGSQFGYAVQALKLFSQTRHAAGVVSVAQLHAALKLRYERIEALLEIMAQAGWIRRVVPAGWALERDPADITVAEVYQRFVFDPRLALREDQPELVSLARVLGAHTGDDGVSVAQLFDVATAAERPSVEIQKTQ